MGLFGATMAADKTAKYNALAAQYDQLGFSKRMAAEDYSRLVGTNLVTLVTPRTEETGSVELNNTNPQEIERSLQRQIKQQQRRLGILESDFSRLDVKKIPDYAPPLISQDFFENLGKVKESILLPDQTKYADSLKKMGWKSVDYWTTDQVTRNVGTDLPRDIRVTLESGASVKLKNWAVNDEMRKAVQSKMHLDRTTSMLDRLAYQKLLYDGNDELVNNRHPLFHLAPTKDEIANLESAWKSADSDILNTLKQIKDRAIKMQEDSRLDFSSLISESEQKRQEQIRAITIDIRNKQRLLAPKATGRSPITGFGD